jgi:hypothetical protein
MLADTFKLQPLGEVLSSDMSRTLRRRWVGHDVRFVYCEITITIGYSVVRHLSPRLRPVPHYPTFVFKFYWERIFDNQSFRFPTSHRQVLVRQTGGLS